MLFALNTSPRASGIQHMDIKFMVNTGGNVKLHFHKLHKSWKKPPPSLTVCTYSPEKQLCVIQTLNSYFEMTKDRRESSRPQLLFSYENLIKKLLAALFMVGLRKFCN